MMIPSLLRKKMRIYNNGNRRVVSGAYVKAVLRSLYPDEKKTWGEMAVSVHCRHEHARNGLRMAVYRMKKRGLLAQDEGGFYKLTDLGRWCAICDDLGVSLVELYLLACACCTQQRYVESGKEGFYLMSSFENMVKEYYSKRHISSVFSTLRRKGIAVKFVKKTLRVRPDFCNRLMSLYGPHFASIESWLGKLKENEPEIISKTLDGFEPGVGK